MVILGIAVVGTVAVGAALVWVTDRPYGVLWGLPVMWIAIAVYVVLGINVGNVHRDHGYHVALSVVAAASVGVAMMVAAVVVGTRRRRRRESGEQPDHTSDRRALIVLLAALAVSAILGIIGGHGVTRALSVATLVLGTIGVGVTMKLQSHTPRQS